LLSGGQITSSTYSEGDAGGVIIETGKLRVEGSEGVFSGVASQAVAGSQGNAGTVEVTVGGLFELLNGGEITSSTNSEGNAGSVKVKAGNLKVEGEEGILSSISSNANTGSKGDAGKVDVEVDGRLDLSNGGQITSSTSSEGDAGSVSIRAKNLCIRGEEGVISSVSAYSDIGARGDSGTVSIDVEGLIELHGGGGIVNGTASIGNAGDVIIRSGELRIEGSKDNPAFISNDSYPGSKGNAGKIDIKVDGALLLKEWGLITSSAFYESEGNAGNIKILSKDVRLNGGDQMTLIASASLSGAEGNAGSVDVVAHNLLELTSGAQIETSTSSAGNAGRIRLLSSNMIIDGKKQSDNITGVFSRASEESLGYVGNVSVDTNYLTLRNGAQISVASFNTLIKGSFENHLESAIRIESTNCKLSKEAIITAESGGNVPAAAIILRSGELIVEDGSYITTSSNSANGGPISIKGEKVILNDGLITTSVKGLTGDGGDILIDGRVAKKVDVLIFDGGFIQANTEAEGARGGDIFVDARSVIAENGMLEVGGEERRVFKAGSGLNVIQAAAPGGEQGTIAVTAPNLDISGTIVNLPVGFISTVATANDPCRATSIDVPSTLILCGKGGFPLGPQEPNAPSLKKERLGQLQ